MKRSFFLWVCLLGSCFVLWGCATVRVVGSGGGMKALAGPVLLEARLGGELLPKFEMNDQVHIVGKPAQKFSILLKNRTDTRWRLLLEAKSQKRKTPRVMVLEPREVLTLREKFWEEKGAAFRFPKSGAKSTVALEYLRVRFFAQKESTPGRVEKREFEAKARYQLGLSYGLCVGYRAKGMYSRVCPAPRRVFRLRPPEIPGATFIRWERPPALLMWKF